MFDRRFPEHWTTNRKLIWLIGAVAQGASAIWKTVTGTLIHITDALPSPVKELSVPIEPQQSGSGDPSPDNIRPITGVSQVNVTGANANLWRNNWYTECGLTLETDESSTYYGFYKGAMKPFGDAQRKITEFNSDGIGRIKITATFGTTGSSFTFRIFFYYSDGTSDYGSNINPATGAKSRASRTSTSGKSVVAYSISTSAGATNTYGRIKDIVVTPYDADSTDYVEPIYNAHHFVLPPQGKNLYDVNRETNGVYISQSGVYTVSDGSCISDFIPVEPGQTYTFSGIQASSSNTKRIHGYSNEVWQEQITSESVSPAGAFAITFTVPSGVDSIIVSHYSSDTNCQVELGSSATAYEQPNYFYGGTLTINEDGSGTLIKKYKMLDGGNQSWKRVSSNYYRNFTFNWETAAQDNEIATVWSSNYKGVASSNGATQQGDNYVWIRAAQGGDDQLCCVKDTSKASMTATEFKSAMSGVQFLALLKEENWTTYNLTAQQITTLTGENNIWTDVNGTITLTYKSDGRDSDTVGTGKADFMTLTS